MTTNPAILHFTPTQDWFSHNAEHWKKLIPLVKTNSSRVLEIGSWEGRSAVFLADNLCGETGEITCIDHFDLFKTEQGQQRYERLTSNLAKTGKKHRVLGMFSVPALMILLEEEMKSETPGFDWIYVDGSHEADDTLLDGELAWRLARKGAVIIFDDYHWNKEPEDSIHHPKRGIQTFLQLHDGQFRRLSAEGDYQVVLQKEAEMRIGFLVGEAVKNCLDPESVLEYGINIALAVDSGYAMAAAVTMRSVVETTSGRITFYVLDCGVSVGEKESLEKSAVIRGEVTVKFLAMPENSLSATMGMVWAKLDLLEVVPVERVLYLDADVLVRANLTELWRTDLGGQAVGAVQDVGHPMGHDAATRAPYFNAGVLLFDMSKVRIRLQALKKLAEKMQATPYKDQDALNVHFSDWLCLSLKWNAQGLGTYAKYPSTDRELLKLSDMDDPAIVHFTGPVHPTLAEALNPYVQPATGKPWGYLGSPGHPFGGEWWSMLSKTGWPFPPSWNEMKEREITKAVEAAATALRELVFK